MLNYDDNPHAISYTDIAARPLIQTTYKNENPQQFI